MIKKYVFIAVMLFISMNPVYAEDDSKPPRVVSTFPLNMSHDVDPSIEEISVTFNREMMDGSWSWAYEDKSSFPQITGQAYYSDDNKTNRLPVRLESNREYVIWINTAKFRNFKDRKGIPAIPFKFTFKTR